MHLFISWHRINAMPSENVLILLCFQYEQLFIQQLQYMPRNISSFIKKYLSTYYVLGALPGSEYRLVKEKDIVTTFIMFIFFWEKSQVR